MRPKTAEEIATSARLLKLIELAPQQQTGPVATEPDESTKPDAPTASPTPDTQTPSSASASPAADPPPSAPEPPSLSQPVSQSVPAPEPLSIIDRCVNAYNEARSETYARTEDRFAARDAGSRAYRNAMPPLRGAENIHDFIACVAQALLFDVIKDKDATKLLYAAQVAFSAQNRSAESRPKLKPGPKPAAKVSSSSL